MSKRRLFQPETVEKIGAKIFYGEEAVLSGFADESITGDFENGYLSKIQPVEFEERLGMMTEETEEKCESEEVKAADALEDYKAEVLEIIRLCSLAHADGRILEFIQEGRKAEEVKNLLLSSMGNSVEINNRQENGTVENPLLVAAKKRAFI